MKYKVGDIFYLKGTKQRFKIVDIDYGNNYYLCPFKYLRYGYSADYLWETLSEVDLINKYKPFRVY
jgi:hypothetical protein